MKIKLKSYDETFKGKHMEYPNIAPLNTVLDVEMSDKDGWCRVKGYDYWYHPMDFNVVKN